MILEGKTLRDTIANRLKHTIETQKLSAVLVIVQVGNRIESTTYINQKKTFGEKIGVRVVHEQFPETVTSEQLISEIKRFNTDNSITGIIVQLPLPVNLNPNEIIDAIDPKKDVDGLTATNTKYLLHNEKGIVPATTRGILTLLKHYQISVDGKKVVIIGRSNLVGKPTALALLNKNATVTITHRHTKNIADEAKHADILIVAAGSPKLVTAEFTAPNQTIIDVGISAYETTTADGTKTRTLVGDVDFNAVKDLVDAITPVPGGVGPMTVASLFENVVDAAEEKVK